MRANRTGRVARWLLSGVLAVVSAGCDLLGDEPGPMCINSLQCAPNQKCEDFVCVDLPKPRSVVDFELTPLQNSGAATTQIPDLDLSKVPNISDVSLVVEEGVLVSTIIDSPYVPGGIPGTLVATRYPDIDGRQLVWNITVGEDGAVEELLSPGTYDMLFKPSNREIFPQLMLRGFQVPNPNNPSIVMRKYPTEEEIFQQEILLLVRGQVLQSQTYPHPEPTIMVEGVTDHGLRTSLALPDAQGFFYLRLPLSISAGQEEEPIYNYPATLDVIIRPKDSTIKLPTVTVEQVELEGPELGTFYLGDLPNSYSFSAVVVDSSERPIPECRLRLAADNIGNGVFVEQLVTDANGWVATTLPGGNYQITAIPGLTSELRMTSTTMWITENVADVSIVLSDRPLLTGKVREPNGTPVPDVIVRAKRLSAFSGLNDGLVRTYEGMTETSGGFGLPLDSGRYHVTFIPPPASGLPRLLPTKPVYVINEDVAMEQDETTLLSPAVVQGHVMDSAGEPMCGVNVDVYRSDETSADLIGQTISGGIQDTCTGSYAVIIPAELIPPDQP